MRHFIELLKNAPPQVLDAIEALGVAESLTDQMARLILKKRGIYGPSADKFLELLHCADYIIPRNNEWHFSYEMRSAILNFPREQTKKQKDIHRFLLNIGRKGSQLVEVETMPAYLFTHAGIAYHSGALGWSNKALSEYAKAANTFDAGELWLASSLSREQQEAGILPANAIEPTFLRGLTAYRNNDHDTAYEDLLKVAEGNQCSVLVAWALQLVGIIETYRDKFELALQHLDKAVSLFTLLESNLKLIWCLNSRSITLYRFGKLSGALSDLERAAAMCDGDWKASLLTRMAMIERELARPERALGHLTEAEALADRELATVLIQKAALMRELGDSPDAFKNIDRAVRVAQASQLAMALNTRAAIHWDLGQLDEAEVDLDSALTNADSTSLAVIYFTRARIRHGIGNFTGALADLEAIIKLSSRLQVSVDSGKAAERIEDIRESLEKLNETKSESSKNKFWYKHFIKIARASNVYGANLRGAAMGLIALKYAKTGQELFQCYKQIGMSYEKASRPELALEPLKLAVELNSESTALLGTLAHTMDTLGMDFTEIEPYFLKSIEIGASNRWAKSWYALALCRTGRYELAITFAEKAIANSNNAILIYNLAVVLDASPNLLDRERAIKVARRADQLSHHKFDKAFKFLAERNSL